MRPYQHLLHLPPLFKGCSTQHSFCRFDKKVDVNHITCFRPIKLAHLEVIAAALHRLPAVFLVDSDAAAAVALQIARNQERCLQVLFFLETLAESPDEVDGASETQPG
jgi:hypothetical protein